MSSSEAEALGAQAAGNGNGTLLLDGAEEDPAAAFLAQQENEIAGIESDEGYGILESGEVPPALQAADGFAAGTAPPQGRPRWPRRDLRTRRRGLPLGGRCGTREEVGSEGLGRGVRGGSSGNYPGLVGAAWLPSR